MGRRRPCAAGAEMLGPHRASAAVLITRRFITSAPARPELGGLSLLRRFHQPAAPRSPADLPGQALQACTSSVHASALAGTALALTAPCLCGRCSRLTSCFRVLASCTPVSGHLWSSIQNAVARAQVAPSPGKDFFFFPRLWQTLRAAFSAIPVDGARADISLAGEHRGPP